MTARRYAGQSPLHTITAFACGTRLCLRQMAVDDKSNEIPAVPALLKLLELSGATVTLDAMNCQVETARAIVAAQADFILIVKGNQGSLHDELLKLFCTYGELDDQVPGLKKHTTVEKSHGRQERRMYSFIASPRENAVLARWPSVRSIGMIYRSRGDEQTCHEETTFVISSHPPQVKMLARHIRGHWGIENRQHWILVVFFQRMPAGFAAARRPKSPPDYAAWR